MNPGQRRQQAEGETQPGIAAVTPALVIEVFAGRASVRLLDPPTELSGVRNAVLGYDPQPGDRVLVQLQADGSAYLTGVLHAQQTPAVRTRSGARAELAADDTLVIRDPTGRMLCTYDAQQGRLTLQAGNALEVAVPEESLSISAARLQLCAGELRLEAETLTADFKQAKWRAHRWEVAAVRIHEKVRDKLVEVDHALQTRAGQVRTLAASTWEVLSRRTRMQSKENTSIDGKRILLG